MQSGMDGNAVLEAAKIWGVGCDLTSFISAPKHPGDANLHMGDCVWDCSGHVEGCIIRRVGQAGPNQVEPLPSQAKPN